MPLCLCAPLGERPFDSQIDRRLPHFPDRLQRITRSFFFRDPSLFATDDVQQQLLVFRGRHVFLQMLFVSTVIQRFATLRVKLETGPAPDLAIELNSRRIELWLAWLYGASKTADQSCNFVAIKMPVVIVQIVQVG